MSHTTMQRFPLASAVLAYIERDTRPRAGDDGRTVSDEEFRALDLDLIREDFHQIPSFLGPVAYAGEV
jgi:hypothetical protein